MRVGIVAMYVAAAFTLGAAAVILALRGEPTQALAAERAVLTAEEGAARATHPPGPLPGPERPKLEPEPERRRAEPPEPKRAPRPQPEPRPESKPEPKPEPERKPERKAKAEKVKPEPASSPKPEPKSRRAAGRSPEPGPARETAQRAEPRKAESRREKRAVRAERKRASAERPRRSGLPAGAVMGLTIEALGLRDVPVASTASQRALDNGVIHLPDTSLPWDEGGGGRNVYLVGHRLGYPGTGSDRIFYRLDELRRGHEIVIEDRRGRKYEYQVTGSRVVWPHDSWVKDPVPGRDTLSLQTCTPVPTFERRLIVHANRI